MEYVEKKGNVENIYRITYDPKLRDVIDKIIKELSYRVSGIFLISYSGSVDWKPDIASEFKLPNGDCVYENVKKVLQKDGKGPYINATQVFPPKLAFILADICNGKENSFDELLNYKNDEELISIDERIRSASLEVDKIDNFCFDEKVEALRNLKRLCDDKQANRYYDTELLKGYYEEAASLISLELIGFRYKNPKIRMLSRNYKPIKED